MNKNNEKSEINELLNNFKENLDELKELLKLPETYERKANQFKKKLDNFIMPLIISALQKKIRKTKNSSDKEKLKISLKSFIEHYKKIEPGKIKNGQLKNPIENIDDNLLKKLEQDADKLKHSISHKIHIEKAVLFNLIAYLEQTFSDISHFILNKHPEILSLKDKSFTFAELKKFSSIEDAQKYLISVEIEKLLYKSLEYFLNFFEDRIFQLKIPSLQKFRHEVIEIKERRNIIMHNNGIVNYRYINTVDEGLLKKFKLKKGDKVELGKKYLEESIRIFELLGLEIISLACLKFQDEKHREKAGWEIISIIYDCFSKKDLNYHLGESLSSFLLKDCKKYLTEKQKDYCLLNYLHILKKQKKTDLFESISSQYDTTAKNSVIKLCFFSVIEDYDRAHKHLKPSLYSEEDFGIEQYKEFPILEGLRKQKGASEILKTFQREKKSTASA